MASRIPPLFATLDQQSRSALVTYVTAGDPSAEGTTAYLQTLVEAGADIIELGMPFSDPMADGPVIQRASERALAGGMSLTGVLEIVQSFRADNKTTPVILMGYLNPIESMGYAEFSSRAAAAGVDGILIVDSPPEESDDLNAQFRAAGLDQIFLISPNSSEQRVQAVSALGGGFVYYVSVKGVTGSKALDVTEVAKNIQALRQHVKLPLGVGFGIRTAEDAANVAGVSDAVIIGSAIVELVEEAGSSIEAGREALKAKVSSYRAAIEQNSRS
ncbi:MAG: tryptophan synthase subunit alpha [Pseudomonadota bacterium]